MGANVLGSPLISLGYLVDLLEKQPGRQPLRAGEIITTGVLTDAHPVAPGETWRTEISGPAAQGARDHFSMRPLEGITVVALEQVIAGPFATRQLAELGARVIKIERPAGRRPGARLRRDGQGPVVAFRLGQPLQGKPRRST